MQVSGISEAINGLSPLSLGIALAALLITAIYFVLKHKDLPPGPIGLPYFGQWAFMNNARAHLQLDAWTRKYGEVSSFRFTGRLFINLGSIKAINEAVISKADIFFDRMSTFQLFYFLYENGVAHTNGEEWKSTKKFFSIFMKDRGTKSVKTSIAGPLYDSIRSTVNNLKAKNGEPVNLNELLMHECITTLRLSLYGEIGVSEEQIRKFNELHAVQMRCMTPIARLLSGTFAKYFIFPFIPNYFATLKSKKEMKKLFDEIMDEHKKTYDPENPRDIIDEYFLERDKRKSKGDPTAKYFTDLLLKGTLIQFTGDSVNSVASFTSMLIKQLLINPEVQEKVYKEIEAVIGLDRYPTLEDKSRLTYFNAYIQEAIRTSDFFNFFHGQESLKETTLGGYRIPKGAILLKNFYSSNRDPRVYEEPEKFDPSRFIPTDGKKRPELPCLFGVGKRSCIGEGYVLMQVFILLATLIQNFQLTMPESKKLLPFEEYTSRNLLICAKPRHNN